MKKLNALKLIIAIVVACCCKANAQDVSDQIWNSNTLNAKDVGQAIAFDPLTQSTYVAGEQNIGLSNQAIRIIKYVNGTSITKKFDSLTVNETVKQLLYKDNKLYVIANATDISGNTFLLLLRFTSSLEILDAYWYSLSGFNNPIKAVFGGSNDIYIACNKKVSGVNKFAVLHVSLDFTTLNWTIPSDSTYRRTPKDIFYTGGNVYVAGSAKSGTLSQASSCFAMKFSTGLGLLWEHTGTASGLNQNGYNTIAVTSNAVYVGGTEYANNDQRWVIRKISKSTGVVSATQRIGGSNFSGDIAAVVKITLATSDSVYVSGYIKNQALNTFVIKSAKYNSSLGAYLATNSTLAYDTKLNDAVCFANGSKSIVTGSTKIGTNYAIFFTEFDNYNQQVSGGETVNYRNAAGNKIILTPGSSGAYAAIIGFGDANTGIQPENLQFLTKFIMPPVNRLSSSFSANTTSSFTMYPNPATDGVTIESEEPISSWVIYDMIGKSVLEQQKGDETFQEGINISTLPKGIYLLKVNNNSTQKLIKN